MNTPNIANIFTAHRGGYTDKDEPVTLVYAGGISDLRTVTISDNGLTIGASVTLTGLAEQLTALVEHVDGKMFYIWCRIRYFRYAAQ